MTEKLLSREEEIELSKRVAQGDSVAREEFIKRNKRLVCAIAGKFTGKLDFEELVQEGQIGLIKAVERFEPELGYRFSTYAVHWIRQAITRAIDNKGDLIRVPVHKKKEITNFAVSLNAPLPGTNPDDGYTYESLLSEQAGDDLEDAYYQHERAERLRKIIETKLTKREAQVIAMRFGLDDLGEKSLQEITEDIDGEMTREGIRQVEKRAIKKLSIEPEFIKYANELL